MPLLNNGPDAAQAADVLIGRAEMLRTALTNWIAACDALSLNANEFISVFLLRQLKPALNGGVGSGAGAQSWATLAAVSGVQAAIRQRLPGFANDAAVTSQLSAIQTALGTLISYSETNVRDLLTDASGWVLVLKIVSDVITPRAITNATQLGNLKTQLLALRSELSA